MHEFAPSLSCPSEGDDETDSRPRSPALVAPRDSSAREVIDSMEQGVIVWSADAICEMHNQRIFEVLELTEQDL
ncbi:MAG: hypothetical protein AAF439_14800, partial [Pseudomonadota bacterium]